MGKPTRRLTEDEQGVWESAEHGKEQTSDEPWPQDLQEQLASAWQERGSQVQKVPVHKDQEQVADPCGRARHEAVSLLAGVWRGVETPREQEVGLPPGLVRAGVDSIGDRI